MDTKEAIDKVNRISYIFEADEIFKSNGIQIQEVINLLKRGEKYEEMWGEHKKEITYLSGDAHYKGASILMNRVEHKYLPKEKENENINSGKV